MSYEKDTRMFETYSKIRRHCEVCGHSTTVPSFIDKTICSWCGNYVFRNERLKFKYRLEQAKLKLNIGGIKNESKSR